MSLVDRVRSLKGRIGAWMLTRASRPRPNLVDRLCRSYLGGLENEKLADDPADHFDIDIGFDPDELARYQAGIDDE